MVQFMEAAMSAIARYKGAPGPLNLILPTNLNGSPAIIIKWPPI